MIMFINHGWHFDVVKLKRAMSKSYSPVVHLENKKKLFIEFRVEIRIFT